MNRGETLSSVIVSEEENIDYAIELNGAKTKLRVLRLITGVLLILDGVAIILRLYAF